MSKIKVGEYIRTEKGLIGKFKNYIQSILFNANDIEIENGIIFIQDDKVVKHSPNIIDLIEVGDYVNGFKVLDIAQAPKKALYLEDIRQKLALLPRVEKDIKTIVTKEQFAGMEYKV